MLTAVGCVATASLALSIRSAAATPAANVSLPESATAVGTAPTLDHFIGTFLRNAQGNPEQFWVSGGQIWHAYWTGTTWSDASGLGAPSVGAASAEVGAEMNYLNNPELYVLGSDGDVYHSYSTPGIGGGWSNWDSLGRPVGVTIVGQVNAGRNYVSNQELYVLGSDGVVYHDFATPGRGSGWSGWSGLGGPDAGVAGDVHAGRNSVGNQELFVVGLDGVVYHDYSTPGRGSGWSGWSPLVTPSVGVAGDLAVWQNQQNNQELFLIGNDHQLWHAAATPGVGSGWSAWSTLGAPAGAPLTSFVGLYQAALDGRWIVWVAASDGTFASISAAAGLSSWAGWVGAAAPSSPTPLPAPPADQTRCATMSGHGAVIDRQAQISYLCNGASLVRTMPFTANNTQPDAGLYHVYARVSTTTSDEAQCRRGCVLHNFLPFTRGRQGGRIGFHLDPIVSATGQYVEPPDQIGTEATRGDSSGCFRLRPDDSAAAWDFLIVGSPVLVI